MKPIVKLFVGVLLVCLLGVPVVFAETTCSFINITAGPPGPMNQTPNMTAGPAGAIPDVSGFCFINGTRAFTGNVSMGGFYINNLTTGALAGDAVNRSYVDSVASSYNASYVTLTNTSYVLTNNNTYVLTGNGSYVLITNTSYILTDGTRAMAGNLSLGGYYINNLITGGIGGSATNKSYVDSVASSYNASYVTLTNTSYVQVTNGSYVLTTNTSYVLTNNGSYVLATNTSYFLVDGTRTMTGNITMGSMYITGLLSGSSGGSVVNKSYVDSVASSYNASYITTENTSYVQVTNTSYITSANTSYVLTNNGSYVLTNNASYILGTNTTHVVNPVFGYVTLMAGSSMVATTNPATMNQFETTTNKNNYISLNFTDGGVENAQWMVDFPDDWNRTGNVIFAPIWTAETGATGTVNWTIAGKLLGDSAVLDTAVVNISSTVDTLDHVNDLCVAPDTTGAAITALGTGNTAIIKVVRDPGDTGTFVAKLIGLRIKYIRSLA